MILVAQPIMVCALTIFIKGALPFCFTNLTPKVTNKRIFYLVARKRGQYERRIQ